MDIGFLLQRQGLRPCQSCIQRPAGDAHGQHGIAHTAAEDAGNRDCQHHLGKSQQNIRQAHDQTVYGAAVPPGHQAKHRSGSKGNGYQCHCRIDGGPCPHQYTRTDAAAVAVGAEGKLGTGRTVHIRGRGRVRVIRAQERCEQADDNQDARQRKKNEETPAQRRRLITTCLHAPPPVSRRRGSIQL